MIAFVKKEPVLTVAAIAAVFSSFFVKPSLKYLEYIDFSVLILLFCLMTVVAGLMKTRLFDVISCNILKLSDSCRLISLLLVNITFFMAMLITNDVALITLVPFSIGLFIKKSQDRLIPLVVAETAAANLGSMIMPFGNPQNLYLYSYYHINFMDFVKIILPYGLISLVLVNVFTWFFIKDGSLESENKQSVQIENKFDFIVYLILFIVCIITVLRILNVYVCLAIVLSTCALLDYKILIKADFNLLLTFCAFFIFVGNLGNIEIIKNTLSQIVEGREFIVGVLASQIISNVPAALMLSGFTDNAAGLLLGTDIGGLGTLVASLASLISYKQYSRMKGAQTKQYLIYFTIVNVIFLIILFSSYFIIK